MVTVFTNKNHYKATCLVPLFSCLWPIYSLLHRLACTVSTVKCLITLFSYLCWLYVHSRTHRVTLTTEPGSLCRRQTYHCYDLLHSPAHTESSYLHSLAPGQAHTLGTIFNYMCRSKTNELLPPPPLINKIIPGHNVMIPGQNFTTESLFYTIGGPYVTHKDMYISPHQSSGTALTSGNYKPTNHILIEIGKLVRLFSWTKHGL